MKTNVDIMEFLMESETMEALLTFKITFNLSKRNTVSDTQDSASGNAKVWNINKQHDREEIILLSWISN